MHRSKVHDYKLHMRLEHKCARGIRLKGIGCSNLMRCVMNLGPRHPGHIQNRPATETIRVHCAISDFSCHICVWKSWYIASTELCMHDQSWNTITTTKAESFEINTCEFWTSTRMSVSHVMIICQFYTWIHVVWRISKIRFELHGHSNSKWFNIMQSDVRKNEYSTHGAK